MTVANGNRAASVTWLTGVTFTALATPLVMFGAQPVDVSLGNATIRGTLDDYAMEYLGAAAVISVGLGASRLVKASSDFQKTSANASSMLLSPSTADSLMGRSNSSLLTEASLKASGLHLFLDEDDAPMVVRGASLGNAPRAVDAAIPVQAPIPSGSFKLKSGGAAQRESHGSPVSHHGNQPLPAPDALARIVAEVQSVVQQMSAQSQEVVAAQTGGAALAQKPAPSASKAEVRVGSFPLAGHHTAPIFPAAQSYVSFARTQGIAEQSVARDLSAELAVLDQIYQVREQMQHLMNQVDLIQAELEQTIHPAHRLVPLRAAQAPSYTVSAVEPLRAVVSQAPDVWSNYRATA